MTTPLEVKHGHRPAATVIELAKTGRNVRVVARCETCGERDCIHVLRDNMNAFVRQTCGACGRHMYDFIWWGTKDARVEIARTTEIKQY